MIKNKGFTLVEILVVIAIVAILGTILVAIFVNTLRGSNKSQLLAVIKQNGQAVLENMDKTIRGADKLVCISGDKKILVVVKNGFYTRFMFTPPTITENGFIQQDNPAQPVDKPGINVFIAGICTPYLDASVVTLTDTNRQTGVSVQSAAFFTPNPEPGYKNSVTVLFTLSSGIDVPQSLKDQVGAVEFKTTIGLR